MVLKGLDETGQAELAHEIAQNHLENVVKVFESEDIHWEGADQFRQYFHLTDLEYSMTNIPSGKTMLQMRSALAAIPSQVMSAGRACRQ